MERIQDLWQIVPVGAQQCSDEQEQAVLFLEECWAKASHKAPSEIEAN